MFFCRNLPKWVSEFFIVIALPSLKLFMYLAAILLPSRVYATFARIGKVIEKIIEEDSARSMRQWGITFRDSEFWVEFHETLLSTLRRCPQISSICFYGRETKVNEDVIISNLNILLGGTRSSPWLSCWKCSFECSFCKLSGLHFK